MFHTQHKSFPLHVPNAKKILAAAAAIANIGRVVQVNFPFFDIFIATVLRDNARKRRKTTFQTKVEIVNFTFKKNQGGFGSVVVENEPSKVGRVWEILMISANHCMLY